MDKLIKDLEELKINASQKNVSKDPGVKELFETYAKAVFDSTFYHEKYLTENSFKEQTSEKDIKTIIDLLNAISSLCCSVKTENNSEDDSILSRLETINSPSKVLQAVVNVLGIEYAECIPWRQGSILYAFCNVKLNTDHEWLSNNQTDFLNYLCEGIKYLRTMLELRKRSETAEYSFESENGEDGGEYEYQPTEAGVYSDTHLLAMIYCAEMCFWYCKYSNEWNLIDPSDSLSNQVKTLGTNYLISYINAVEKFFHQAGWSCHRAKNLYDQLRKF